MSEPIDTPTPTSDPIMVSEEGVSIPSEPSLRRRKLTSKVWNDFEKVVLPTGEHAICKHCKGKFSGSSSSGTSHLKNHLSRCPRRTHKDVGQQLLSLSKSTADLTTKLQNFKFDQERSRLDLAKMIIKHEYPFNMVEHDYFQIFISNLQPMFKLVSRNIVRNDVLTVYKDEKERLYQLFEGTASRISLTTDMWTSDQNTGYLCLTAHFIDHGWELRKKIIAFVAVDCPHDADTLSRVILELTMSWNIDKKLFSITVDNASTNDLMLRELRSIFCSRGCLPLDGKLFHVRCTAHILNIIVQDGLHEISSLLQKIRDSVKYVKLTPNRKQKFQHAINQVRLQGKKGVSLDVSTRWNSTYLMLQSALDLKDAFIRLAEIDKDYKINPSEEEWKVGHVISECLKYFYDATLCFSRSKYPTANIFFPEICEIYIHILAWEKHEHAYVVVMADKMKKKFEKYWDQCNLVLAVAVVFDPRYKMELVRFYYKRIYPFDDEFHVDAIHRLLSDLYMEYACNQGPSSLSAPADSYCSALSSSEDDCQETIPPKKYRYGFGKWYKSERSSNSMSQDKSELDQYLEEKLYPDDQECDILLWWRLNTPKYPILEKLAHDILAIQVSTVASESAFSTGGRVLDQTRNCLLPDIVEALLCCQSWLESKKKVAGDESNINMFKDPTKECI